MKVILLAVVLMLTARVLDFDLSYMTRRIDGDDKDSASENETPPRKAN
jgi:hypothetical protein